MHVRNLFVYGVRQPLKISFSSCFFYHVPKDMDIVCFFPTK
uniref:Uncharacterized protein n=1 Tax=Arundo donax TaxID=35708 RepID=A0A0A8Z753_ARUDO